MHRLIMSDDGACIGQRWFPFPFLSFFFFLSHSRGEKGKCGQSEGNVPLAW